MRHHALGEQAGKRLRHLQAADPGQRPRPEAGVEQVQDRMLDAADILIDGQPAFRGSGSNGCRRAGWRSG
jgi:hypothetical protein